MSVWADAPAQARPVRSFVRREGRLTPAQARAILQLWPQYGLAPQDAPFDLDQLFGRRAPRALEIGYGSGDVLAHLAQQRPDWDFLGIEVHRPGVGRLLQRLHVDALANVRLLQADAAAVLPQALPAGALDEIYILFPDPWPKLRHHKRRLLQPAFVQTLARITAVGGRLYLATDWADYAEHMRAVLAAQPHWSASAVRLPRPVTRFEHRGRAAGRPIVELSYERR